MSETDLITFAMARAESITGLFAQIITINFAMVVAIYYFLNQAKRAMKIFAFIAYGVGMLMFFFRALEQTSMLVAALQQLRALPRPSPVTQQLLAMTQSWLGVSTSTFFNVAYLILWIGTFYLLFIWKRTPGPV
ncbi:MAG TPA: hypothetical protein VGG10_03425 [Rhizomicrobium sp.]|jgi:hypothetical protein